MYNFLQNAIKLQLCFCEDTCKHLHKLTEWGVLSCRRVDVHTFLNNAAWLVDPITVERRVQNTEIKKTKHYTSFSYFWLHFKHDLRLKMPIRRDPGFQNVVMIFCFEHFLFFCLLHKPKENTVKFHFCCSIVSHLNALHHLMPLAHTRCTVKTEQVVKVQ